MVLLFIFGALTMPQDDAPEDPQARRAAPTLLVDGRLSASPDWCRGWPIVVRARLPKPKADETPAELRVEVFSDGKRTEWPWRPVKVGAPDAATAWMLSAEETAKLPEGLFRLDLRQGDKTVGTASMRLVALPAEPAAELLKQGFHARLAWAGAIGDAAARTAAADAYAERLPKDPDAHVAKGDALAAADRDADALKAYELALALWGEGVDPPAHIVTRYERAMQRLLAKAPTRPAAPLTKEELDFFAAADAADEPLKKGDYAEAVRCFERALRIHRNAKLTLDASLVEAQLDAARKAASEKKKDK